MTALAARDAQKLHVIVAGSIEERQRERLRTAVERRQVADHEQQQFILAALRLPYRVIRAFALALVDKGANLTDWLDDSLILGANGAALTAAAGVLLAFNPLLGAATLLSWALIAGFFRYSSLASLVSAAFAPAYFLLGDRIAWSADRPVVAALALVARRRGRAAAGSLFWISSIGVYSLSELERFKLGESLSDAVKVYYR